MLDFRDSISDVSLIFDFQDSISEVSSISFSDFLIFVFTSYFDFQDSTSEVTDRFSCLIFEIQFQKLL